MTCPPTFAAPAPSDMSATEAPSLPADLFMRLYPWMGAGDACLYAVIDRHLAQKTSISLPGIAEGVLRRQWSAEPLTGDGIKTVVINYESNGSMLHDDSRPCDTASGIFMGYAALCEEESCADVWSGHRLVLSIPAVNHHEIRFTAEYVGPTIRRAPREPHPTMLCPAAARTTRQTVPAARMGAGLAAASDNSLVGAAQSPADDGTLNSHARHAVAESHRRGERHTLVSSRVTPSVRDGTGADGAPLPAFAVCRGDDGGDDADGGPGSIETGRVESAQEYPLVQPSIYRAFSVAAPSSPRRRRRGTPWQAVHKTDGMRRRRSNIDADEEETTASIEQRGVSCGDRAVFASHRMARGTVDDNGATGSTSERHAAPVRAAEPHLASTETTATQTVADIVALYPDLTVEQAARVFAASAQLDKLPYAWVAIEAFGRGRCMATSLRASAAAMLRLKTDYDDAADWYGGRRVVLALGNARDTILYRVVGGRAPEAKRQTDDDLTAVYPLLSPIEAAGVCAINRALGDVPRVWVAADEGHHPHRVSLGSGGPPVTATVEAVRRLYDHRAPSHIVLSLGRTPAGALTLDYGAVAPHH